MSEDATPAQIAAVTRNVVTEENYSRDERKITTYHYTIDKIRKSRVHCSFFNV